MKKQIIILMVVGCVVMSGSEVRGEFPICVKDADQNDPAISGNIINREFILFPPIILWVKSSHEIETPLRWRLYARCMPM